MPRSGAPLMNDVTRILSAIEHGDARAAELLPLVYDELRRLATEMMAGEKPGQTLQATALVHEAYLRLVGGEKARRWNSRGHFFAAAAEARRLCRTRFEAERLGGFPDEGELPRLGVRHSRYLRSATSVSPTQVCPPNGSPAFMLSLGTPRSIFLDNLL
jgi:ECF sigma factor